MQKELKNNEISLGIELGSTRIKTVLIDKECNVIAIGKYEWENQLIDGLWTYDLNDVWIGIQEAYKDLNKTINYTYNINLTNIGSIGVSAMMHGYLVFDKNDNQLVPFRTWRNTTTEKAAKVLTEEFAFNIPQRWSIAHLYQAILDQEPHVKEISYITTLAGYVHYKLTGEKVVGIGEGSGMFPIDKETGIYNKKMIARFNNLMKEHDLEYQIEDILPKIATAGMTAGILTQSGARLLDPSGALESEVKICPPEGDAGTGMVATNTLKEKTGNISAGTSIFSMVVLEKELSKVYPELDIVSTPTGAPVAMVHCNNCTGDINAWIHLFDQVNQIFNNQVDKNVLYGNLFRAALDSNSDVSGLLHYNYYSGEPITETKEGIPLFMRLPDAQFDLSSFMKSLLYSSLATLKIGMDILTIQESVEVVEILGHGGFFITESVGQSILANALKTPVVVMKTASEGGAWGMAILANYMLHKESEETLEFYLDNKVFKNVKVTQILPDKKEVAKFEQYINNYKECLAVEREAIKHMNRRSK